ncbi:MAG TPA: helix-turn-helix domain-containing protein [Mycobacteriales bacterium]|nr:helix-turn-helix domain-containing protein [Mycobacteriales bacterium]
MSANDPVVRLAGGTTRETILVAAQRLFSEQGYDATSLRQIADAVGTTKAAVYYHFPAKEHLLLELTRPWLDDLGRLVTEMRSAAAAPSDVTATLEAYLDLCLTHLTILNLLANDPATSNHPDIGRRAIALIETVKQQIAGVEASDAGRVQAACAIGAIHAVASLPADVARAHRTTFLDAAVAALRGGQSSRRNVATQ